ncbi:restriction endonuclease subunit S [Aerococcus urinaeequi]|uniref:restriction endonuclease subunit S n=1 Tax=Aerococcus urinaeequi TaxID=51665 RepID=UPI003D6A6952
MSINKDSQTAPKLRFKGFTDDWEQRKLINVVDRVTRRNTNLQSKIPLTISAQFGLVDQITYFSKQVASKNMENYFLLYNGDFAYNKSYSKGYPFGAIKRLDSYDSGALSTLYIVFRPTIVDSNFLVHYFETTKWYAEIIKISAEGARNHGLLNITPSDFFDIKLFIPSKSGEQEKIGTLLNYVEKAITLHQRKLDQLKQLKEALLQQMFPGKGETVPKLRFAGFEGDWEERKFDEFLEEFIRKSKIENEFTTLSSTNSGMEVREGRVSGDTNIGYKIIENDDLVLSPQNLWLGNINLNYIGTGLVSPSYKTFKIKNLSSSFLKPQLRSKRLLNQYELASTQGASVVRRNLDMELFYQITLPVPVIQEQYKIGKLFKDLDDYIVLQSQKVNKLKSMKEVLLQNMFI